MRVRYVMNDKSSRYEFLVLVALMLVALMLVALMLVALVLVAPSCSCSPRAHAPRAREIPRFLGLQCAHCWHPNDRRGLEPLTASHSPNQWRQSKLQPSE